MSRRVKTEGKYSGLRDDGRPFPEILVGITEIAAYLRKSPRAVSRWISEGMLPAAKDAKGRRWTTKGVIDQLVLQIYKAEREHKPPEGKPRLKGPGTGPKVVKIKPGLRTEQERASCPHCGVYEEPHNTGCPTKQASPPDRCHDCGGLWPDGHESACPRLKSQQHGICPYCQVEPGELHSPGCPIYKARPVTTAQQRIEQATKGQPVYAEPLEIELDQVQRGKLIISEPEEPGSGILVEIGRIDKETLRRLIEPKPVFGGDISFKPKG